jgi:hypothetical protein
MFEKTLGCIAAVISSESSLSDRSAFGNEDDEEEDEEEECNSSAASLFAFVDANVAAADIAAAVVVVDELLSTSNDGGDPVTRVTLGLLNQRSVTSACDGGPVDIKSRSNAAVPLSPFEFCKEGDDDKGDIEEEVEEEEILCASLRRSNVAGPLLPPPPPPPLDGVEITTLPAEARAAAGRMRT